MGKTHDIRHCFSYLFFFIMQENKNTIHHKDFLLGIYFVVLASQYKIQILQGIFSGNLASGEGKIK